MKKLLFVAAAAAIAFSSCKKTSKGKLSNEWVVSSMDMTSTYTSPDNDTYTSTVKTTDNSVTVTESSSTSPTTFSMTGVINSFTYTINKDGSWSSTVDVTFTESDASGKFVSNMVETTSGTWDFLGGVSKDWKKNERVVFNTTRSEVKETETYTPTSGSASTDTNTDTYTYADGEVSSVFVIVESKNKELQLKQEGNSTNTWSWSSTGSTSVSFTDKEVSSTIIKLIQK
jgi:hypothetical protein